ncbi:hypothetical protein ACKUVQ_03580 [Mycobacterium seoulense]|uniref:hypothetical protein n=1 Tax=Mycobacterium seoulense TaxID=386911 RepID=UPI003CEC718E
MSAPHPAYRQPYAPWQANYPSPPGNQPLFRVRIRKHTGAVVLVFNQTYTVTGTFAQCEAALHDALLHNLLAGWWSVASILGWNWIALLENHTARRNLRRQAAQAHATRVGTPWAPSPAPPVWR